MKLEEMSILDCNVPQADEPIFEHMLRIYGSETNKTIAMWMRFLPEHLGFRPDEKSMTVEEIFKHQLLSERRFFSEFLNSAEPASDAVLPENLSAKGYSDRLRELAIPRLAFMAICSQKWWLEKVKFFDVERERIWIFWRRVVHTAHHRGQLSVYLRLLGQDVPATYGPSADETWEGATPTVSVEAAG
jgi:uncharacterized damage-inducible protein DinB